MIDHHMFVDAQLVDRLDLLGVEYSQLSLLFLDELCDTILYVPRLLAQRHFFDKLLANLFHLALLVHL